MGTNRKCWRNLIEIGPNVQSCRVQDVVHECFRRWWEVQEQADENLFLLCPRATFQHSLRLAEYCTIREDLLWPLRLETFFFLVSQNHRLKYSVLQHQCHLRHVASLCHLSRHHAKLVSFTSRILSSRSVSFWLPRLIRRGKKLPHAKANRMLQTRTPKRMSRFSEYQFSGAMGQAFGSRANSTWISSDPWVQSHPPCLPACGGYRQTYIPGPVHGKAGAGPQARPRGITVLMVLNQPSRLQRLTALGM